MRQHAKLIGTVAVLQAVGAAGMVGDARAQTNATYLITFDGQVTPQNPTMTVGIWATWEDPAREWIFGAGNFDLTAGDGQFSNLYSPLVTGYVGSIAGNQIIGGTTGQLHIPVLGFIGSRDNPILIMLADWTTTDFTPRSVVFGSSNTTNFIVAEWGDPFGTPPWGGATKQLYPHQFTHGRAVYVIPAPSALALIALGGLAAVRRRRVRGR
ncbi:MAG: PEP-CTERM sorting domain-containing protein [Planctomycetes bacterium]|nr:PEP-CTERM sorting domain-containing protein [Planctomycetota bacterium]